MGFLNTTRRRNLSGVVAYYSSWCVRDTTSSKLLRDNQLRAASAALFSPYLLLPALHSAPRRCTSHRPMDQLIKVCTLILSFVLLWDYNFPHLKVEQYAKNSDPINKGEGTSQGAAVVQCEHRARNLLGGKPQKTSLYRERQHIIQTALLHSLAGQQHGDFEAAARWCFNNFFISSTATGKWHVLMRTTFLCNSTEKEITTLQITVFSCNILF